jgi:tetratricopeptide (TPR) repeat protein
MWEPVTAGDSVRRDYLLGLLASRVGDDTAAIAFAGRLEKKAERAALDSPKEQTMSGDLALSVRADLAWRAGRQLDAMNLLQRRHPNVWYPPEMDVIESELVQLEFPFLNQAYERWMQAELLSRSGRASEALDWYAGLGIYVGEEMAYLTPSRVRMGEIYQQLGDTAAAVEQYARAVRLWSDCDPELRPLVNEVRGRLARLRRR